MPEVYALDLDEELLAHLADPDSIQVLRDEEISPAVIEDDFVVEVFEWQFEHLREHKQPATATVLSEEFDLDLQEPLTAIGDLIVRLRERWIRNHARGYMEQISDAYKEDPAKVIQVLPRVAIEVGDIVNPRGEQYGTGDLDRVMHRYDQAVLRGPGPSFGFDALDKHFHGMRGVTFGIAPPKTYKSWIFGPNVVVKNIEEGKIVHLYSLELPADETDMRIRCLAAGVPYWKYLRGSLTAQDRQDLQEASEILDSMGAYKVIKPAPGHRSIEEMVDKSASAGADCIVIDQLQYVETRQGKPLGSCDPREFWTPLNKARDLSDDIPLLIVHQFNRSVMNADGMPEMQQAKGSSAIEETATLALGIWANKDMRRSNMVELGTLASRHYTYEAWEVQVELSRGCNFELLGVARHDDE